MPGESVYCFMYYFLKSKREKPEKVKKELKKSVREIFPGKVSVSVLGLFTFFFKS